MRIVIGEDSALFREGLARLIEDAGHIVVARVAEATAAHELSGARARAAQRRFECAQPSGGESR